MDLPNKQSTPVIFNHSAAIDDFVATALLLTMPNIELQGIVVTNADCLADPAMKVSWMVHRFFEIEHIPLTLSNARGWNSFPYLYRKDCIAMGKINLLKPFADNPIQPPYPSGEEMVIQLLEKAIQDNRPVTVLATGPITTITNVVKANPALAAGINKIVWMGGAIDVWGNLDKTTIPAEIANDYAEWNAFWDPAATASMFETFSNVNVFPLDITNAAKIPPFMTGLEKQLQYKYSEFVYQAYGLVSEEPFYCMWNTCATAYLAEMTDIFQAPEQIPVLVEELGFNQGSLKRGTHNQEKSQNLFMKFSSTENFYNYVLKQLQR